ncbi:hypothetical protein [Terrisporobacter hibernicus]|uniref:Uncharacterized protein n=1 Tax=Terrisporobacter hibernicus TaxID=2813371 RepID=A0AAX2ZEQ1_9FIRM|nr:hypothetical protein [Terrisporobacter hibernicus]UEL47828.1 hypothetical protein JW646_19775 [Terrisporobacter hibernicus]
MTFNNKKVIIDVAYGSITNKYSDDSVVLVGEFHDEKSNHANSLQLVINRENDLPITVNVPYNGYNMQLFVGDFTGDKIDNIMIRGEYENPQIYKDGHDNLISYELGVIYKYESEKLIEIFNMKKYKNNNLACAKFKSNYRASVSCGKKKYLIDLSARPKEYLNKIYDEDKKVKTNLKPTLDNPSEIFPIKEVFSDCYSLLIYQRIVGINNSDVIGTIETLINLNNNNINIIYEGLLSYPYEEVNIFKNKLKDQFKEIRKIFEGSKFTKTYYSRNKNNNSRNDDLNLIIKSMDEEGNRLYVDAYLLNLKSYEIKSLSNLKVILKDDQSRIVGNKVFNKVDIGEGLKSKERIRILLSFFSNEYNMFEELDINNLICEINYDARS